MLQRKIWGFEILLFALSLSLWPGKPRDVFSVLHFHLPFALLDSPDSGEGLVSKVRKTDLTRLRLMLL